MFILDQVRYYYKYYNDQNLLQLNNNSNQDVLNNLVKENQS